MQEFINDIISVFNANPVAQIVWLVAMVWQIISALIKEDRKFIYWQTISIWLWALHFWLISFFIPMWVALLNMIRWFIVLKIWQSTKLFFIFLVIYLINWYLWYKDIYSILWIIGSLIILYTMFFFYWTWIKFRIWFLVWWSVWMLYHIFATQSIWSIISQTFMMTFHFITLTRLYKDKKLEINKN
jgi:hypothetical protein